MIRPVFPAPGDRIAIVAPSSPFDDDKYRRGAAWLSQRYALVVREDVHARSGYLAGDDDRRARELNDVLRDPGIRAVVAARGGYGATRILSRIEWGEPKWIVGFSDITALHVEAMSRGWMSLHAPMLAWLGDADEQARGEWLRAFEHGDYGAWDVETLVGGDVEGVSFGGNLALLQACAAAGRLQMPANAIVFLEDCTERPYRLDRMITSLLPHLSDVRGIVLGDFTDCGPGADGVTADDVMRERLSSLNVPIVARAPFGHGSINRPFPIGARCAIRGRRVSFSADSYSASAVARTSASTS